MKQAGKILENGILFGYNAAYSNIRKIIPKNDPDAWIKHVENDLKKYKYYHYMLDDVHDETKKSLCS